MLSSISTFLVAPPIFEDISTHHISVPNHYAHQIPLFAIFLACTKIGSGQVARDSCDLSGAYENSVCYYSFVSYNVRVRIILSTIR